MKNFKIIASVTILFVMSNVCLNASDKSKKLSVQDQRVVDGLRSTIKVASKKADLLVSQKKEIPAALAKEFQMAKSSLDAMAKKTGTTIEAGIKGTMINPKLVEKADTLPAIPEKTETMSQSTGTGTKPSTNVDQAPTGTAETAAKNLTAAQKALVEKATKALKLIKADNNAHVVGAMAIWVRDDNLTDESTVKTNLEKAKKQMPFLETDLKNINQADDNLNQAVLDLQSMLAKDKNNDALKAAVELVGTMVDQAIPLVTEFESKVTEAKYYIKTLENKANEYKTKAMAGTAPTGTTGTAPTVTTGTATTGLTDAQKTTLAEINQLAEKIKELHKNISYIENNITAEINKIKTEPDKAKALSELKTREAYIFAIGASKNQSLETYGKLQRAVKTLTDEIKKATTIADDVKAATVTTLATTKENARKLDLEARDKEEALKIAYDAALADINARPSGTTATAPMGTTATAPKDLTAEEKTLLANTLAQFDNIDSAVTDNLSRVDDIKRLANIDLANAALVQTNYTHAKPHMEQLTDNLRHMKDWKKEIDQATGKLLPLLKQGEQTDAKKLAQEQITAVLQAMPTLIANFESGTTEATGYYKKLEDKFNANKTAGA